jgi:hypothetical protein
LVLGVSPGQVDIDPLPQVVQSEAVEVGAEPLELGVGRSRGAYGASGSCSRS